MNLITVPGLKLEREALCLCKGLRRYTRLHAHETLSNAAWGRYERRTRITNLVRRLERMAA